LLLVFHAASCQPPVARSRFTPDIDLLDVRLHEMWANRQVHEQVDRLDLSAVLSNLRREVAMTTSPAEFAPKLRDALVQIGDGHLGLIDGGLVTRYRSGLSFRETSRGIALTSAPPAEYGTLARGDLLVRVGELPVAEYLETRRIRPGSTPAQRRRIALDLLSSQTIYGGEAPSPQTLTVRRRDGEQTIDLDWVVASPPPPIDCVSGERLRPTVGLLRVHTFSCPGKAGDRDTEEFVRQLATATRAVAGASDLIIDLRDNGGGWDEEAQRLAGLFIRQDVEWSRLRFTWPPERKGVGPPRPHWVSLGAFPSEIPLGNPRLAVLIGPGCFSACDVVAHAFRRYSSAQFFGEPTGGGAGGPTLFTLPVSGFIVRIPAIEVYVAGSDTELIETHPVIPDVVVLPRADAGDTVLEDVLVHLAV
jgi:C-terminal processing protease CtpA/Prc